MIKLILLTILLQPLSSFADDPSVEDQTRDVVKQNLDAILVHPVLEADRITISFHPTSDDFCNFFGDASNSCRSEISSVKINMVTYVEGGASFKVYVNSQNLFDFSYHDADASFSLHFAVLQSIMNQVMTVKVANNEENENNSWLFPTSGHLHVTSTKTADETYDIGAEVENDILASNGSGASLYSLSIGDGSVAHMISKRDSEENQIAVDVNHAFLIINDDMNGGDGILHENFDRVKGTLSLKDDSKLMDLDHFLVENAFITVAGIQQIAADTGGVQGHVKFTADDAGYQVDVLSNTKVNLVSGPDFLPEGAYQVESGISHFSIAGGQAVPATFAGLFQTNYGSSMNDLVAQTTAVSNVTFNVASLHARAPASFLDYQNGEVLDLNLAGLSNSLVVDEDQVNGPGIDANLNIGSSTLTVTDTNSAVSTLIQLSQNNASRFNLNMLPIGGGNYETHAINSSAVSFTASGNWELMNSLLEMVGIDLFDQDQNPDVGNLAVSMGANSDYLFGGQQFDVLSGAFTSVNTGTWTPPQLCTASTMNGTCSISN